MKQEKKISKNKKIYPGDFKTFTEFMDDCLRRCNKRMRDEIGFGIPEVKQLDLFGDIEEK